MKFPRACGAALMMSFLMGDPFTVSVKGGGTRSLSLEDYLAEVIQGNLSLSIERLNPELAEWTLRGETGAFEPTLSTQGVTAFESNPGGSDDQGRPFPSNKVDSQTVSSSVDGLLPFGLSYSLSANVNHRTGTTIPDPVAFASRSSFSLTMPLLKNLSIDTARWRVRSARNDLKVSRETLRQRLTEIVLQAHQAYYNFVHARELVAVRQLSEDLAKTLWRDNQKRVQMGALAPLEEKQAASQVSARSAERLAAERDADRRQNTLKDLMSPDFTSLHEWQMLPTEKLLAVPAVILLQDSWEQALDQRSELLQARLNLQKLEINIKYYRNQRLPTLDLVGSYGLNGIGPDLNNTFSDLWNRQDPRHSVSLVFSIPLGGNRRARSQYEASKINRAKALLDLKRLEQTILIEVDNAVQNVESSYLQVDATKAAREYAEAALKAEETKLDAGRSTSFVVLQLQRDLTDAQTAELRALVDYNLALVDLWYREGTLLERVGLEVEGDSEEED